ncbi:MAG: glycosyltransferase family 4 protein [Spirochaetia bacterium]|nr:glycosyltransferase family 4 protein [Spirochaetia bacterium]
MKRVLLITDFFRPEPGGIEGFFTGIARRWQPGTLEVCVTLNESACMTSAEERLQFDRLEAYPVHRISAGGMFSSHRAFDSFIQDRITLFEPRHLIFGNISRSTVRAANIARTAGLSYSLFLTGADLKRNLGVTRFFQRRFVLGARNIFTLSRHVERSAREAGVPDDRMVVIPPGLELRWSRFKKFTVPQQIYERIKGKMVLVALGPFVARKGLDTAIEAIHRIRDEADRKKLHLLLIGSGPESAYLEELIRSRGLESYVTLTGFLPDDQLAGVLGLAHIFIQPGSSSNDTDAMGTSLMEAAYFGIPSIAGRAGVVEEIVRHGISGSLFEPGNVDELCRAILDLAGSDRMQLKLGKNAREIAGRDFDLARTCAAIQARI